MNIKKYIQKALITIAFSLFQTFLFANNILVNNVSLTGQNPASQYTMVKFDISWENSWRTSTPENKWDAAWIFVKYRRKAEKNWHHAYLNNEGHIAPTGSEITPGFVVTNISFDAKTNPAVGVFLYRNADSVGTGNVNYTGVQLRWNYGVSDLAEYDSVEVCVFALEMVYIPTGSFYVGDGPGSNSRGCFVAGNTQDPFQITSEEAITINNQNNTQLWQTNATHNDATIGPRGTLPAEFPKGYQSFYIMKYELSQYMYKEFLNKLTRKQQGNRVSATKDSIFMAEATNLKVPQNRNGIKVMLDPGGSLPRVYGNDLNNNWIEGEDGDGQHIACNWISFYDLRAFADWSGLRPFTELEYEKACRGPLPPVANEYAWGNIDIKIVKVISNSGKASEVAQNPNVNIAHGNETGGPLRCGIFARSDKNIDRERAGAGYYGVMEMSGNLSEYTYSVGLTNNRSFNGNNHGDGIIDENGSANVAGWPLNGGLKGSNWLYSTEVWQINAHQTSARNQTSQSQTNRRWNTAGLRLGRTQP